MPRHWNFLRFLQFFSVYFGISGIFACVSLGFGSDVLISYVDMVRPSDTSFNCVSGWLPSVIFALSRLSSRRGGVRSRGWQFGWIELNWLLLSSRILLWPRRWNLRSASPCFVRSEYSRFCCYLVVWHAAHLHHRLSRSLVGPALATVIGFYLDDRNHSMVTGMSLCDPLSLVP
jgi:hypothetical protein